MSPRRAHAALRVSPKRRVALGGLIVDPGEPGVVGADLSACGKGADLRDVQIAARRADPQTTMRYDRARNNLDRHPNYVLAAYMASGT